MQRTLQQMIQRKLILAAIAAATFALVAAAKAVAQPLPPRPTAPPASTAPAKLGVTSGVFKHNKLTLQLTCAHDGTVSFSRKAAHPRPLGSAHFGCTAHRSSAWITLGTDLQQALHTKKSLGLIVDLRSAGAHFRTTVTLRPTSSRADRRLQQTYEPNSAANAVSNAGVGTGGQIAVHPMYFAALGASHYGAVVYWQAWLYCINAQTGKVQWVPEPAAGNPNHVWHSYTYLANGAAATGPGTVGIDAGGWNVIIGDVSGPGVRPASVVFTINSGWYAWPMIESYTDTGYHWFDVPYASTTGAVKFYNPNWVIFG